MDVDPLDMEDQLRLCQLSPPPPSINWAEEEPWSTLGTAASLNHFLWALRALHLLIHPFHWLFLHDGFFLATTSCFEINEFVSLNKIVLKLCVNPQALHKCRRVWLRGFPGNGRRVHFSHLELSLLRELSDLGKVA